VPGTIIAIAIKLIRVAAVVTPIPTDPIAASSNGYPGGKIVSASPLGEVIPVPLRIDWAVKR
jgi:hypothetical protein